MTQNHSFITKQPLSLGERERFQRGFDRGGEREKWVKKAQEGSGLWTERVREREECDGHR